MSKMKKLLAVISIGQRAYGRWLFQRLLPSIILMLGLTIIIAIMISAILVGGLYTAYGILLHYGVEPNMAMLTIALSSIITIIILVVIVFLGLRYMRQTPKIMPSQTPIASCAIIALNSFIDGLMRG